MRTNISTIALEIITVMVLLTTQGLSQTQIEDYDERKKMMTSMPPYPQFEELGLSEEQVKRIKEVQFEMKKKEIEINSKIEIAELELRKMMMDDAPEKEFNRQIDKITDQIGKKRKLQIRGQFEIKKSLTDEQWQSFKKRMHGKRFMDKMHDKGHGKRRHNWKKLSE